LAVIAASSSAFAGASEASPKPTFGKYIVSAREPQILGLLPGGSLRVDKREKLQRLESRPSVQRVRTAK
jgi:hypothetical protein